MLTGINSSILKDLRLEQQSKLLGMQSQKTIKNLQLSLLKTAEKVLDSTAAKKVIHKNAAARTKSRLVKAVKAIS